MTTKGRTIVKQPIRMCAAPLLALVLLLSSCAGSEGGGSAAGFGRYTEIAGTEGAPAGFTRQVDAGDRTLLLNEATAEIAVRDNATGTMWYSNPQSRENDSIATDENKEVLASQLFITYQNPMNQTSSFYSFKDSVRLGAYQCETIARGFQVTYHLGAEDPERGIPKALTKQGYEALLARFQNKTDQAAFSKQYSLVKLSMLQKGETMQSFLEKYPRLENEDLYILRTGNKVVYAKLRALLESVGYSEEDLNRDETDAGYVEKEEKVLFQVGIRYELVDGDLVVTIPVECLAMPAGYTITTIGVLPYFAAEGKDAVGDLVLPDGCGSVIRMNNGKTGSNPYEAKVYGGDMGNYDRTRSYEPRAVHLPVFGISGQNSAVFAIIEGGAETATLHAMVSGMRSENNNAYVSFAPVAEEYYQLGNTVGAAISFLDTRYADEDMSVRYKLFSKSMGYSQMAQTYRRYLIEKGRLAERAEASAGKAYLELTGAVTSTSSLMGIPYEAVIPLTTFGQADEILQALEEKGVNRLAVKYTGWNKGGVRQGLPAAIAPESRLGGARGFQTFLETCRSRDIALYLNYNFQTVTKTDTLFDNFSKGKHAARTITGKYGRYVPRYRGDLYTPVERQYVLKPSLYSAFSAMVADELQAFSLTGVSLEAMGSKLAADYDDSGYCSLSGSTARVQDALRVLTDKSIRVLSQGVNDYAFSQVTDVVELDSYSAEYTITDYAIPFLQMVLSGSMDYAGAAFNYDDADTNFLKALETGSLLYIDLMYADNSVLKHKENLDTYYTSCYRHWIDAFGEAYGKLSAIYEEVGGRVITGHCRLADKVYGTTYESGKRILVNYADTAYTGEGVTVPAHGYAIV